MLIVAAERQTTIDVLCSIAGVYRVSAALSAVIRGITTGTAYVWIPGGCAYRVNIIFERRN